MFDLQVTSMGWQGWTLQTPHISVGVDLLFVSDVGRGPAGMRSPLFGYRHIYHWEAFPRLDAYVITHEHEDHFNIPTLARLDRSIPIYISSRASIAATAILTEMGFASVHPIRDGQTICVDDLEIEFFANTEIEAGSDEFDTLAYLVRTPGGTFFTEVDTWLSPAMLRAIDRRRLEIGDGGDILCSVSMALSLWPPPNLVELERKSRSPQSAEEFTGDFAACLASLRRGASVDPPAGMTARIAGHRLRDLGASAYFEKSREVLPERRTFRKAAQDALAPPFTGSLELSRDEVVELEAYLKEIAEYLYGRDLYLALIQLGASTPRLATFALVLHVGSGALIYEYYPQACNFRSVAASPDEIASRYEGVVAMWARDLVALGRGVIEPRVLGHQIHETWHSIQHELWRDLWLFYHPQRFPERVLGQYRRILRDVAGDAPTVHRATSARRPAHCSSATTS